MYKIKIKKDIHDAKPGTVLIDFFFELNTNIDQSIFCKEGNCKNCYTAIMRPGKLNIQEVLACKTKIYSDLRVISARKSLQ